MKNQKVKIEKRAMELLERAKKNLSYQNLNSQKVVDVARRISDLDRSETIKIEHMAEAITYGGDLKIWVRKHLEEIFHNFNETEEELLRLTINSLTVKRVEEVFNVQIAQKLYDTAKDFWKIKRKTFSQQKKAMDKFTKKLLKEIDEPLSTNTQKKKIQQIIYNFVEKDYNGGVDMSFRETNNWCEPYPFSVALAEEIVKKTKK